jgi:predicted  nucleic acid-binding Zn-ribbon protein
VELSTATDSLQHSNHRQDVLREEITRLGVLNQKLATELEGLKAEHERQVRAYNSQLSLSIVCFRLHIHDDGCPHIIHSTDLLQYEKV